MSTIVTERLVPDLRVSFNATVEETDDAIEKEDAVLECLDGKRFAVARRELAVNSGFFKGLFRHSKGQLVGNYHKGQRRRGSTQSLPVYRLPFPVTSKHLASVLNFIHEQSTDSLCLTEDNVIDVAVLADFLDVQDVTEECSAFMATKLTPENVCGMWKFSQMYRIADLESAALRFLCEHFADVCMNEEFLNLLYPDLITLFNAFNLGQASQETLWLALVRWNQAQQAKQAEIMELSRSILFNLMNKSFLNKEVRKNTLFQMVDKDWSDELLLIFGGDFIDSRRIVGYNSITDSWRKLPIELPDPCKAPGDRIQSVACGSGVFLKRSINCYWMELNNKRFVHLNQLEKRLPALAVRRDEILILSGSYLPTWLAVKPSTGSWKEMWPNLRQGRVGACAAVVKNKIFVLGGQTIEDKAGVTDCEMLDSFNQCWVKIAPMHMGRTLFATVVLEGEIYVTGGQSEGIMTGACEKYNPVSGVWTKLPDLNVPRRGHVAVVLEQVVFVIGGETATAEWLDLEEEVWVETNSLPTDITGAGGCVIPLIE